MRVEAEGSRQPTIHYSQHLIPRTRHSERSPRSEELCAIARLMRDESPFDIHVPAPTAPEQSNSPRPLRSLCVKAFLFLFCRQL